MRSLQQTLEGMCLSFEPSAAQGLDLTVQFEVRGDESGVYHLRIAHEDCTFHRGSAASPTLTIRTPSEIWLRISRGEISGREALMEGLYEVGGDVRVLMRLDSLFPSRDDPAIEAASGERPAGPIPLSGMQWLTADFAPWIVLWILFGSDGSGDWPALALSLSLAAGIVIYRQSFNHPTRFELASTGVFAGMLLLWSWQAAWLATWGSTAGTLALGVIWLATLWPGRFPLTSDYSRWKYVPALATNGTFVFTNSLLTLMWGWLFVIQAGLAVWGVLHPSLGAMLTTVSLGLLVPAVIITARIPRRAPDMRLIDPIRSAGRLHMLAVPGLIAAVCLVIATILATSARGGA